MQISAPVKISWHRGTSYAEVELSIPQSNVCLTRTQSDKQEYSLLVRREQEFVHERRVKASRFCLCAVKGFLRVVGEANF